MRGVIPKAATALRGRAAGGPFDLAGRRSSTNRRRAASAARRIGSSTSTSLAGSVEHLTDVVEQRDPPACPRVPLLAIKQVDGGRPRGHGPVAVEQVGDRQQRLARVDGTVAEAFGDLRLGVPERLRQLGGPVVELVSVKFASRWTPAKRRLSGVLILLVDGCIWHELSLSAKPGAATCRAKALNGHTATLIASNRRRHVSSGSAPATRRRSPQPAARPGAAESDQPASLAVSNRGRRRAGVSAHHGTDALLSFSGARTNELAGPARARPGTAVGGAPHNVLDTLQRRSTTAATSTTLRASTGWGRAGRPLAQLFRSHRRSAVARELRTVAAASLTAASLVDWPTA